MTPATSIAREYQENKRATASKPAAKVSRKPRRDFSAKLDAGINWFSRNLTGQQKRPVGAMNEQEY
jgi:hypothetical protein